ncbi:unnamed protein product [Protopolystoma xenopodis]|uniref:Uncharacterized protein n=1 Tax=Protopolystoma xenopodis TaxID=117903 RepID=A0A3S5CUR2_9PLAT|nr:unnamed protein product [Protopolystoma xenopodis]
MLAPQAGLSVRGASHLTNARTDRKASRTGLASEESGSFRRDHRTGFAKTLHRRDILYFFHCPFLQSTNLLLVRAFFVSRWRDLRRRVSTLQCWQTFCLV